MSASEKLEAALAYAARGYAVLPLQSCPNGACSCSKPKTCEHPGKHPRTEHGKDDATTDAAAIRAWWKRWPDANIGLSMGASGLAGADVDVRDGKVGLETWLDLKDELGAGIEDTAVVETPTGGLHFYYEAGPYRILSAENGLGMHVDVKAEGGYLVAPPSSIGAVEYAWAEGHELDRLAALPEALGTKLAYRTKKPKPAEGQAEERLVKGMPGGRHGGLMTLAVKMRNAGAGAEEIGAALHIAGAKRCSPPYTDADKIDGIVRWVMDLEAGKAQASASAEGYDLAPLDWQALLRDGVPEVEYISEPYLPKLARIWVWGQTGSMKSLWCLHEAARLSREGVRVSYFSEENPIGEELRRLSRMAPSSDYFRMFHRTGMDLADDKWIDALLAATKGDAVAFLDSWTDLWSGDEDSNRDMQKFDAGVLKPLQAQGVTPVVIHHMGHQQMFSDRGGATAGRGASSLGQKADVTLTFKSAGDDRFTIVYGKSRIGGTHHPPCSFKVEDTDDGRVEIAACESPEDRAVAELAETAAQAVLTAPRGYLTTTELRVVIGGSKSHQTAALALLGVDSRVHAGVEKVQTRDGKFRDSKVWRPAGGALGDGFDFAADGGVNASTHPPIGVGDGFMGSIPMPSNPSAKSGDGLGSTSTDGSAP